MVLSSVSHLDGSPLFNWAEGSDGSFQRVLGSDIAMTFDECPPHDCLPKSGIGSRRTHAGNAGENAGAQPRANGTDGLWHRAGEASMQLCGERCAREVAAMDFDSLRHWRRERGRTGARNDEGGGID